MKLVVESPTESINLEQLVAAYRNGAIIGAVSEDELWIWVERENYGEFCRFGRGVSTDPHSRREFEEGPMTTLLESIKLNLGTSTRIYVFADMHDLAKAIIDNGWE